MENNNIQETKSFFSRNHLPIKAGIIAILTILLLIPTSMVESLIWERKQTSVEAQYEVLAKWGSSQSIVGPILSIGNNTKLFGGLDIQLLPKNLVITSDLKTQSLKRGMYDAIVYTTEVTMSGNFELPASLLKDNKPLVDTAAYINVGLTDLRGLTRQVALSWDSTTTNFTSGTQLCSVLATGVNAPISMQSFARNNNIEFEIKLLFNGSDVIHFAPLGEQTDVSISSNYSSPSFNGAFLPQTRQVSDSGFKAQWSIINVNRDYPQLFSANYTDEIRSSTFGVNLITPVEQYQQAERTVKYAFLIIILTFVLSFFIEVIQKKNIHPFQYLLIGLTLCLFYTLLISISEHLGFDLAYLIASFMTISLITFYILGILKIKKTAFTIGIILSCLYLYIYTMIQMETYALLTGSIGLFVIMALIMYFSQRIKWNTK